MKSPQPNEIWRWTHVKRYIFIEYHDNITEEYSVVYSSGERRYLKHKEILDFFDFVGDIRHGVQKLLKYLEEQ